MKRLLRTYIIKIYEEVDVFVPQETEGKCIVTTKKTSDGKFIKLFKIEWKSYFK